MVGAKVEYTVYIKVTGYICKLYQEYYVYFTGIALTQPKNIHSGYCNSLSTEIPKSFKERLTVLIKIFYYIVVCENLQKEQGHIQVVLLFFLERQMQCCVLTGNQT